LTRDEKISLINYRLERANESIQAANILLENELFIPTMNRIYYSMFYAIQALLVLEGVAFSKHVQIKGYFNRVFIKTGTFPIEFGKLFNAVFDYRQKFDYVDLVMPEKSMVEEFLDKASEFVSILFDYTQKHSKDL